MADRYREGGGLGAELGCQAWVALLCKELGVRAEEAGAPESVREAAPRSPKDLSQAVVCGFLNRGA